MPKHFGTRHAASSCKVFLLNGYAWMIGTLHFCVLALVVSDIRKFQAVTYI
jgi:hypothetical protein